VAQTVGTSVQRLHDGDVGDAATLAHGLQAEALVVTLKRVDERGYQLRPGRTERVAERNGAAVDIEPRRIGTELLQPRQRNRRERLIDLVRRR
jgi:anti-sigma factor RsiW